MIDGDGALSAVAFFATLLSLIAQFKEEHSSRVDVSEKDFIEYVLRNHHSETAKLLQSNIAISTGIRQLLQRNSSDFAARLDSLDAMVASIAARIVPELSPAAIAIHRGAMLPDQAVELLRRVSEANGSVLIVFMDGRNQAHSGDGTEYSVPEWQMLDEDVDRLVEFGLMRRDPRVEDGFVITRSGKDFVKGMGR